MKKDKNNEKGDALTIIIVIVLIGVIAAVIGFYAYQVAQEEETQTQQQTQQEETEPETVEAEHTMRFTGDGYEPRDITIKVGDTIEFVNESSQDMWPASNVHPTHELYPEFDAQQALAPGDSWQFTFDEAGTWGYHDHLNSRITGTITVTE